MNEYAVIDVETSGLNPDFDEIIRLSALEIKDGKIAERFSALAKPAKPLTEEIELLTGITNADLAEKHAIIDLLPDFLRLIGNNPLVSHNICFAVKFINAALEKAGMAKLTNKTVDTLDLSRKKCRPENFSLRAVAKFLGVNHKALPDDEIVFCVYEKLKTMEDLPCAEESGNVFIRNGKTFIKKIQTAKIYGDNRSGDDELGSDNCNNDSNNNNCDNGKDGDNGGKGIRYYLYCKIPDLCEVNYCFAAGSPFIEGHKKVFYLENSALETLNQAVNLYESERENTRRFYSCLRATRWEDYGITVYYEYSSPDDMLFNVYPVVKGIAFNSVKNIGAETVFAIVKDLTRDEKVVPRKDSLKDNPLYRSAEKYNDNRLIAKLISLYGKN